MNNNIVEAISVHEITKTFDLNVAVNNVSFSVPKGEVVGFGIRCDDGPFVLMGLDLVWV